MPGLAAWFAEQHHVTAMFYHRERLHHVEQIEDDVGLRAPAFDGVDVGLPHVDGHGLNALPNLGRHSLKELVNGGSLASLTHPDDTAGVVVEHHCHVVVPFLDRDFINGQTFEAVVDRLAEIDFESRLINLHKKYG